MGQAPDPLKFHVGRTLFRKAYGVLANEHLMHPIDQGDWPVRIDGRRQLFTEDDADSPELLMQTRKHKAGTIVVLPRRTMHHDRQKQPERIHGDVSLSAADHFAWVIAAFRSSNVRRLHTLAIDNGNGRRRLLAYRLAAAFAKSVMNSLPRAIISPEPNDSVDGFPFGKAMRKRPSLTSISIDIPDGIDHLASIHWWTSATAASSHKILDNLPLLVRKIAGITLP